MNIETRVLSSLEKVYMDQAPKPCTVPFTALQGEAFAPGKELENVSLKDIAPTIAKLLDAEAPEEWEGRSLV